MKTTLSPVLALAALLVGVTSAPARLFPGGGGIRRRRSIPKLLPSLITTALLGMACYPDAQPAPYLLADINADPQGSSPQNLVAVGSTVFFRAYDPTTGWELWKSDGTTAVWGA